jgi:hypothetical protein
MMRLIFTIASIITVSTLFSHCKGQLVGLTQVLEKVYKDDQEPRLLIDSLSKRFGYESKEVNELWQLINRNDSINTIIVTGILDQYGWLSEKQTSNNANVALFLVIQHAPLPVQLKYLPLLQKAVEEGKATPKQYAYLLDRTNMRQGKLQVYGSQLTMNGNGGQYFFPIWDEPNVNKRREKVGLSTLEKHAQNIGFTYVLPKVDSLKDKFVLIGFVMGQDQKPIAEVQVIVGSKVVGVSDQHGIYRAIIEKELTDQNITFKKEGYLISEPSIDGRNKEVSELHVILTRP